MTEPAAGPLPVARAEATPAPAAAAVPPSPWYRAEPASPTERVMLLLLGLAGAIVLSVAILLPPSSTGHGTHQALGLPPCSFLAVTGVPCLSCGMTTSFAHTVRGELLDALAAQPFGTFLAVCTILFVPVFFAAAATGRSVARPLGRLPWNKLGPLLLVGLFAAWGYKIGAMKGWFG